MPQCTHRAICIWGGGGGGGGGGGRGAHRLFCPCSEARAHTHTHILSQTSGLFEVRSRSMQDMVMTRATHAPDRAVVCRGGGGPYCPTALVPITPTDNSCLKATLSSLLARSGIAQLGFLGQISSAPANLQEIIRYKRSLQRHVPYRIITSSYYSIIYITYYQNILPSI